MLWMVEHPARERAGQAVGAGLRPRASGGGVSAAAPMTSAKASTRTATPSASSGIGSPKTIGPEAIVTMFAAALVTAMTATAPPSWSERARDEQAEQRQQQR